MWDCLNIYLRDTVAIVPVTMSILKFSVTLLVLCLAQATLGKPFEQNYNEGRGIGSTIWGWLTYPFSWWNSGDDAPPVSGQLVRSTTREPFEPIEIGKHNVTIWCNDQTCTTMRCDKFGCVNVSCNIYDTDLNGECRKYNTITRYDGTTSEKPRDVAATATTQDKEIVTTASPPESTAGTPNLSTDTSPLRAVDERPLELEAVLSSSVTDALGQPTQT